MLFPLVSPSLDPLSVSVSLPEVLSFVGTVGVVPIGVAGAGEAGTLLMLNEQNHLVVVVAQAPTTGSDPQLQAVHATQVE